MEASSQQFGLSRPPFAIRGHCEVVLATEPVRRVIQAIEVALLTGATQICVSGRAGCGKTSLARALPRSVSRSPRVAGVVHLGDPSADWCAMRASLASQLGLPGGDLSRRALIAARHRGCRFVLVADNAERLSGGILDRLDALLDYGDAHGEPLFSLIAIAEADPSGTLAPETKLHSWLDPVRTVHVALEPLDPEGVHGYIEKRLQIAGHNGTRLFSRGAAFEVHRITLGNPRGVNALCRSLLSEASRRGECEIRADLVRELRLGEPATIDAAPVALATPFATEVEADSQETWSTLWAMALVALLALLSFAAAAPALGP